VNSGMFTICNAVFKTNIRLFADQVVEGRENIPEDGPAIFIANHTSNLDPPIVAAITGRKPGILAKVELFKFRPFAMLLNAYGAHPLKRGLNDISAIRWGVRRLTQPKGTLLLFPEGTRNQTGDGLRKALPGVTQIALMTGAPIIPVGLTGAEPLQHFLKALMPRAILRVNIGKPIVMIEENPRRPSKEQVEAMTTEIMVRVAHLLPESYRGYYRELMDTQFIYTKELGTALVQAAPARAN
jgi:1-acyl-sn-glycerol-3-phosphate acyltransferase